MGRFLVILGIILMAVGFIGPMFGMNNFFSGFQPMLELATDSDAQEAELCETGETLEQETGMSSYTQGMGYASSVQLFCVDEEGNRREVTGDLANSLFDNDMFGGIGDFIGQTFMFVGLGTLGIFLTIIGSFMSFGKRKMVYGTYGSYGSPMMINTPPMTPTNSNWQGTSMGVNPQMPTSPNAPQNLSQQLQQLEDAYKRNLLSREEYDKARQKILDSMAGN